MKINFQFIINDTELIKIGKLTEEFGVLPSSKKHILMSHLELYVSDMLMAEIKKRAKYVEDLYNRHSIQFQYFEDEETGNVIISLDVYVQKNNNVYCFEDISAAYGISKTIQKLLKKDFDITLDSVNQNIDLDSYIDYEVIHNDGYNSEDSESKHYEQSKPNKENNQNTNITQNIKNWIDKFKNFLQTHF